jgi:predicted SAM-dependent methyltransferase
LLRHLLLFLFSHRFLAIARWEFHFLWIRLFNVVTGQGGKIASALSVKQRPLFLNLASGPRGLADEKWINVDGFNDTNVDFLIDLRRPIPFPDGAFDGVFSEHVLEHFTLEEGEMVAREVCRILSPGGYFRIVVPDAEVILKRYFEAPELLISHRAEGKTAMEAVNSFFRQRYEHQFLYDWPTMEKMLLRAGFDKVCRVAFGQSQQPQIALDDVKYEWESLYVEATKSSRHNRLGPSQEAPSP